MTIRLCAAAVGLLTLLPFTIDTDTFTDGLWNPMAFTVLDGDQEALVIDYATDGEIVYRLDLHAGAHHGRALEAGPGPGELNDEGDKIIGQFADGSFFSMG